MLRTKFGSFFKFFSSETLGQMIRNLVGSIYGRSSIKSTHFVPIPLTNMATIDASYQVSDHLAMRFQRKRFLEIDQSETRINCGGHVCYGSERNEH
jgi:hypothetical protein